jgi:hypothetical protein
MQSQPKHPALGRKRTFQGGNYGKRFVRTDTPS